MELKDQTDTSRRVRMAILASVEKEVGLGTLDYDAFHPVLNGAALGFAQILASLPKAGRKAVLRQVEREAGHFRKAQKALKEASGTPQPEQPKEPDNAV